MLCKNIVLILFFIFISNCTAVNVSNKKLNKNIFNPYSNKGFALIYSDELYQQKILNKKINDRSLVVFQKKLRMGTPVKITNIINNKSLIATVGKNSKYPSFNNVVLSKRIAGELDLDLKQPYVEIFEILESSIFIAQKAKTFEEEKKVAVKAPVNAISINDLSSVKKDNNQNLNIKFSYTIKIVDFYFADTAKLLIDRINNETFVKNPKIQKISDKKYRVYLGPFDNIISLQKTFNDISILQFENIEIIKND
tara:strand:+ start:53 stop:811 length:759 start_codon:yes stop_codon:yes gene_type:complete